MPTGYNISRLHLTAALVGGIAAVALTALPACLPPPKQSLGPAPIVNTDAHPAEYAHYREKVLKSRTVPPREYSVAPVAPRNNDFGEFDDMMYAGLDSQPTLPPLPGGQDIMPMVGGPGSYPMAAASYGDRRVGDGSSFASYSGGGVGSASGSGYGAMEATPGVTAGGRFHAIEQLVYGGDNGELDKAESYRLMPKDVISVTVKDHPEFSAKLEIQADGTVRIPNCPEFIRLRGLTVDEAAETLRDYLQVFIKGEAVVNVQANRARGGYYFVFGDVTQPGRFPMGMEPIKLSDAVLAANWEANPNRMDPDEELGPAFPAASARGKFYTARTADLARVMLITPHRSQPVRTSHDIRSAMLGATRDDPLVRPGQIIVVPSLDPRRNQSLGLDVPGGLGDVAGDGVGRGGFGGAGMAGDAFMPGQGFSGANSSGRLPEINPNSHPSRRACPTPISAVEENMAVAFGVQSNTEAPDVEESFYDDEYCETDIPAASTVIFEGAKETSSEAVTVPSVDPSLPPAPGYYEEGPVVKARGRRLLPRSERVREEGVIRDDSNFCSDQLSGWKKGF